MEKLTKLIKKLCTKEVILYIVFGVLTTIINLVTFKLLNTYFNVEANLSSNIGIVFAVLVAYFTNRKWVFNSSANTFNEKLIEFIKFIASRAVTMIIESAGFYLLFSIFNINKDISKISITVIVIILNYFFSKFFTFKKSK